MLIARAAVGNVAPSSIPSTIRTKTGEPADEASQGHRYRPDQGAKHKRNERPETVAEPFPDDLEYSRRGARNSDAAAIYKQILIPPCCR
jgi:hypothetical protein